MNNLQKIKDACIKANPGRGLILSHNDDYYRLADVLLAVEEKYINNRSLHERFFRMILISPLDKWNLKDDNLEHQSEECVQFISNLLD